MAIQDYIAVRSRDQATKNASKPVERNASELAQIPGTVNKKVVGVGTGGCNSVKRMMHQGIPSMTFAMVNTDDIGLDSGNGLDVIQIGANKARAWGQGGDYRHEDGSLDDSSLKLRESLSGANLVFVTAGMGGGTGTGAIPYVAHLAREQGALVVALVTAPFGFEGRRRMGLAVVGVDQLRPHVDKLILVHNDRLLNLVKRDAQMVQAFRAADEVVAQGVMGVSELVNLPQEINVGLDDVCSVMRRSGGALMAVGRGTGVGGPIEAARQAVGNPLLDRSFGMSTDVIVMIKRGTSAMTLEGVNSARDFVAEAVGKDANIFIGVRSDESMDDAVSLTMIATGLQRDSTDHRPQDNLENLESADSAKPVNNEALNTPAEPIMTKGYHP
jgi:cell division protein FtsZ